MNLLRFNSGRHQMLELPALHFYKHKLWVNHQSLLCKAFMVWKHGVVLSLNSSVFIKQLSFYLRTQTLTIFHTANKAKQKHWPRWSWTFTMGGNRNCFDAFKSGGRENFSQACQKQFSSSLWATQPFWCLKDQTSYCYSNETGDISVLLASWPSWSPIEQQQPLKQLLLWSRHK